MNKYITAFKWDGKRDTVLKNMPKINIKEHVRGIRLLDRALLIKNGSHQRTVHTGNIVILLPVGGYTYCTPKDFKQNWTKARG